MHLYMYMYKVMCHDIICFSSFSLVNIACMYTWYILAVLLWLGNLANGCGLI